MPWSKLFEVDVLLQTIVLVVVTIIGIVVLVRLKPFKNYSSVKLGAGGLELQRSSEDVEKYQKLLDFAEGFNQRLDQLTSEIKGVTERADAQYRFIKKATVAANVGVLWGDKAPPYPEVINGGFMLLMLGQDGNVVNRMVECIMGLKDQGKEIYRRELNKFREEYREQLKDNQHFHAHIEKIEREIH